MTHSTGSGQALVPLVSDVEAALTVIGKTRRRVGVTVSASRAAPEMVAVEEPPLSGPVPPRADSTACARSGPARGAEASLAWAKSMARACGRGLVQVGPREYVGFRRRLTYIQDYDDRIVESVTYELVHATGPTVQVITPKLALSLLGEVAQ